MPVHSLHKGFLIKSDERSATVGSDRVVNKQWVDYRNDICDYAPSGQTLSSALFWVMPCLGGNQLYPVNSKTLDINNSEIHSSYVLSWKLAKLVRKCFYLFFLFFFHLCLLKLWWQKKSFEKHCLIFHLPENSFFQFWQGTEVNDVVLFHSDWLIASVSYQKIFLESAYPRMKLICTLLFCFCALVLDIDFWTDIRIKQVHL